MAETGKAWFTSLTDDRDWYGRTFTAYCKHTDRHAKTRQFCTEVIPKIIVDKYAPETAIGTSVFRYLGIGSGAGTADIHILKQLTKTVPSIRATILEPCQDLIDQFEQNIAEEESHLDGVTFDFRRTTLEEYRKECEGASFDCVTGFSVLYYFANLFETLSWLHSVLNKGGTLVFLTTAEECIFTRTWDTFPALTNEKQNNLTCDVVVDYLTKIGAQEVKQLKVIAEIDVSECFEAKSEEGNLLVDFITHSVNFRKTAPPSLVTGAVQLWKEMSVKRDNRIYVNNNFDYTVAKK
ncbi:histamine N-methyltransferase-like [Glandiceps talaboti]